MPNQLRHVESYDPNLDLAVNWPDWTVQFTDFHGVTDEVIDIPTRTLLVDVGDDDPGFALAHALAHLDLGHHQTPGMDFTEQQEADAQGLAELRMTSTWRSEVGPELP